MTLFKRALSGTIGAVCAVNTLVPQKATAEKPNEVAVVSSVPLTVSAQQSGVWNVGLIGTPSFNLSTASGPLPVRNVDDPARHAYAMVIEGFTNRLRGHVIPAGKRFIVQHLSADMTVPSGTPNVSLLFQIVQDGRVDIYPPITPAGNSTSNEYMANAPVQAFIDSNSIAFLVLRSNGGDVSGSPLVIDATLSGYLVDCSSTTPCEQHPF